MTYTSKIYEIFLEKKKILLTSILMVITVFSVLNFSNAYAITALENPDKIDLQKIVGDSNIEMQGILNDPNKNGISLTNLQIDGVAVVAAKWAFGADPDVFFIRDTAPLAELPNEGQNGFVGIVSKNLDSLIYNPPSVDIVAHLSDEWIPGYSEQQTSIYAESGYQYLQSSGLGSIWDYFRTIAYVLFVIVMIIAGFMVMFRKKIGGQLLVTIYNTIPRVIIGLILVTFSFAIVGIIIDIGGMLINVASAALISLSGGSLEPIPIDGPFALFDLGNTSAYTNAVLEAFGDLGGGKWVAFLLLLAASIGSIGIVPLLLALLLVALLTFASIRVYITLLKSYLALIIDLILAPIFIAFGAFPGSQSTMNWLKRVVKNVLTFVLVFFFVNLGFALMTSGIDLSFPSGLASPANTVVGSGGDSVIGFTIKLLLPILLMFFAADAPKMLEDALPSNGGKGFAGAVEGFKGGLQKIPLFGGMVK